MPAARYQIPQHPTLGGPHTKDELYILVDRGSIGRGEIVVDRVTGRSHKVGELVDGMRPPKLQEPNTVRLERPAYQEFSGDTPWELKGDPSAAHDLDELELESSEDDEPRFQDEGDDLPGAEYEIQGGKAVMYHGHPSWLAFARWLLLALVFAGAGAAAYTVHWWWAAIGAVMASATICGVIIARQHRDYTITTDRIELEWGILGRSSKEVRIKDVRSIDVDATGLLGVFGIGNLNVSSAGSDDIEVQFKNVRRAHKIKELIRQLQERSGA